MRPGTATEHCGIDAVDQHRDQDPDVAAVERQLQQDSSGPCAAMVTTPRSETHHTGCLPERGTFAEQREDPG